MFPFALMEYIPTLGVCVCGVYAPSYSTCIILFITNCISFRLAQHHSVCACKPASLQVQFAGDIVTARSDTLLSRIRNAVLATTRK